METSPPPKSVRAFPTTSWDLLAAARAGGAEAEPALGEIFVRYHRPVEAFLRRALRTTSEDAEDLAQDFFRDRLLTGRLVKGYQRNRGQFRPFLKQALRNYIVDRLRREAAAKRSPEQGLEYRDQTPGGWNDVAGASISPETAFHTAWVRALLDEVLRIVRAQCAASDQSAHCSVFEGCYLAEGDAPPWDVLGAPFGWDGKTTRHRADVVIGRFRRVLIDVVSAEVGSDELAVDEIKALLALLKD